jgi:hypothetical protein
MARRVLSSASVKSKVRRIIKFYRGPFTEQAYERLKERIAEDLYGETDSQEQVVKARKESLTASVRRTVETGLEADRAELEAVAAALHEREAAVAARERKASPSYRARFLAVGAALALSADALLQAVSV